MSTATASELARPIDPRQTARLALACLDLTSLNDDDTEADMLRLCERAQGPHGPVAAVCVWPRFAALVRRRLPATIAVAAVANFPHGTASIEAAVADVRSIVDSGAQEVDLVLPYLQLAAGDERGVAQLLGASRAACPGLVLKIILESGTLGDDRLIARASRLALNAGADFLKTSTGKTPVSATPAAARVMLDCIAAHPGTAGAVGFKPSGGIRTVADAGVYVALASAALGPQALEPRRFRIGASSLLDQIESTLGGAAHALPMSGY